MILGVWLLDLMSTLGNPAGILITTNHDDSISATEMIPVVVKQTLMLIALAFVVSRPRCPYDKVGAQARHDALQKRVFISFRGCTPLEHVHDQRPWRNGGSTTRNICRINVDVRLTGTGRCKQSQAA